MKSASKVHVFFEHLSKVHQKCIESAKVHLITLVKFTNVSEFLVSLVKIYVHPR